MTQAASLERLRRWRLLLGKDEDETGSGFQGLSLSEADARMDQCLEALYDSPRSGGSGRSMPNVARWLGDIREYFPRSVVQVMQTDALKRLNLQQMLTQPEVLEAVQPDIHLVATLVSLNRVIPAKTRQTARLVVRKLVDDLERRLANPLRQAVLGALNRSARNRRPKLAEIDWPRTIKANLRHYQARYRTVIPETRIGFGRKGAALKDVILCVDQSGSMASSVVYSSIMAAVLASIRSVRTQMVVFDTAVVDLTDLLADPVEVLFGTQLGGGTDIDAALGYCQMLVRRPADTVLVLITDLFEGGDNAQMLKRAAALAGAGCTCVCLLALDDRGKPMFDENNAKTFAELGIPTFGCTPDKFPELMAAALSKRDLRQWAAEQQLV